MYVMYLTILQYVLGWGGGGMILFLIKAWIHYDIHNYVLLYMHCWQQHLPGTKDAFIHFCSILLQTHLTARVGFLQVLEFMFFAVLLTVATIMFMAMSCCYTYYYTSGHGNGFDDIEELIIEEKNEDIPLKHSNHPKHKWSHHEANTGKKNICQRVLEKWNFWCMIWC